MVPVTGLLVSTYTVVDFLSDVSLPTGLADHVDPVPRIPIATSPSELVSAASVNPSPLPMATAATAASNSRPVARAPETARPDNFRPAVTHQETPEREAAHQLFEITQQATYGPEADARAKAIQQLSSATDPEAVLALSASLRDRVSANRFLGVESLRLMAWNTGDPDGSIRILLQSAAQDSNNDVAQRARSALDELRDGLP